MRIRPPVVSKIRRTKQSAYGNFSQWETIKKAVKDRDGHKCRKCAASTNLDVHHIIPTSRGGRTALYNLITLCRTCHAKQHKHMRH